MGGADLGDTEMEEERWKGQHWEREWEEER